MKFMFLISEVFVISNYEMIHFHLFHLQEWMILDLMVN